MTHVFPVPKHPVETEYLIKKSRFIARVYPAQDREEAMHWLDKARKDFPDARHHCWAYLIGPPQSPRWIAMSDDGEPGGTAGKPILNVMQHKGVGNVMVIVIRYFGGIKLGAGGLVRAYSQATQQAYDALEVLTYEPRESVVIVCGFAEEQLIRHELSQLGAKVMDVRYDAAVNLHCELTEDALQRLEPIVSACKDAQIIRPDA